MCGLFGWDILPRVSRRRIGRFGECVADEMAGRGGQAWGIRVPGRTFRGLGPVSRVSRQLDMRQCAGHTRFATHGAANEITNAHPFEVDGAGGRVTLAHNGIIDNAARIGAERGTPHAVDSYQIAVSVARDEPLARLSGYGSIWYERGGTVFVSRMTETGDLAVARLYDGEGPVGVAFASTADAITEGAERVGWTVEQVRVDVGVLMHLSDGDVYATAGAPSHAITARTWELDARTSGADSFDWRRWDVDDAADRRDAVEALVAAGCVPAGEDLGHMSDEEIFDVAWDEIGWLPPEERDEDDEERDEVSVWAPISHR